MKNARNEFAMEEMEGRTLLSAPGIIALVHGHLLVKGNVTQANTIDVGVDSTNTAMLDVSIASNGATNTQQIALSQISGKIVIDTGLETDTVTITDTANVIPNQVVILGHKNDTITTGNEQDLVFAGGADTTITTGNGPDTIFGLAGHDTLTGGNGGDVFFLGQDDSVTGGTGNDIFVKAGGRRNQSTVVGGGGTDTSYFTGWRAALSRHDKFRDHLGLGILGRRIIRDIP